MGDLLKAFLIIGILVAVVLGGLVCQPVMEAKTYNKLTGSHATWWDALWVELRVATPTKGN